MFLGMWVVMMVAMMLPSLVPMLWRYRQAVATDRRDATRSADHARGRRLLLRVDRHRSGRLCARRRARGDRDAAADRGAHGADRGRAVVLIAGALQFTRWKLRHLACCRPAPVRARTLPDDAATAYRYGVRLGLHCAQCCAGLIAILLVIGVMDLAAMAVVAVAITVERVLPAGERVARIIGAIIIAMGLFLIAR